MSKKIEETVWNTVADIITGMGYELVDVEYNNKRDDQSELIIYIDSENGVTIEDTEKVSRAIDGAIDEADPVEESYVLCVSSPGLDRPLRRPRDFEKYMGRDVDVKLYSKRGGKKEFTGALSAYDGTSVTIDTGKDSETFLMSAVAQIRLHIDF